MRHKMEKCEILNYILVAFRALCGGEQLQVDFTPRPTEDLAMNNDCLMLSL